MSHAEDHAGPRAPEEIAGELKSIAERAGEHLRSERGKRAVASEFSFGLLLFAVVPVLFLLYLVMGRVSAADPPRPAPWMLILASLVLPLGWLLSVVMTARGRRVDDASALALVDEKLELSDRLSAASEFLGRESEERTPFMEAAIADAEGHLEKASAARLASSEDDWSIGRGPILACGLGMICLIAAIFFPAGEGREARKRALDIPQTNAELTPEKAADETDAPLPTSTPREDKKSPRRDTTPALPTDPQERRDEQRLADEAKETEGATGSGTSADASAASGSSRSQGSPSQDAQASDPPKKKAAKKKAKKSKKKAAEPGDSKKRPGEKSGATAGKGAASGSNKSPAPSEWSSKDQVTSEDEEELETEAEVEDEDEENEARGGVQPSLRDRRPPVNRDLGIGFGNQKNPDANGRGGPSEQKKSRGVATLVLGVPIPDHIKGRPSPGRTKITQERIQPKPDTVERVQAEDRGARRAPAGLTAQPDLLPWMRSLVKNYYLRVRAQAD